MLRTISAKIQKNNIKNLTPGATKNSLNATKRIIKKAYLEPKLLNFERCSFVPTKLPQVSCMLKSFNHK
jgi:hypothetical protein